MVCDLVVQLCERIRPAEHAWFDELRARSEGENDFDAAAVLKLCSVLRYRPSTPADGPPTPGSLRELRESSTNDGLSSACCACALQRRLLCVRASSS